MAEEWRRKGDVSRKLTLTAHADVATSDVLRDELQQQSTTLVGVGECVGQ
jgi:hypothetical protein